MNCSKIEKIIYLYREGELEKSELEQLKRHLSHCASCQKLYDNVSQSGFKNKLHAMNISDPNVTYEINRIMAQLPDKKIFNRKKQTVYQLWEKRLSPQILFSWLGLICLFLALFAFQQIQFAQKLSKLEVQMNQNAEHKRKADSVYLLSQILSKLDQDAIDSQKWMTWLEGRDPTIKMTKQEMAELLKIFVHLQHENKALSQMIKTYCPEIDFQDPSWIDFMNQQVSFKKCPERIKQAIYTL